MWSLSAYPQIFSSFFFYANPRQHLCHLFALSRFLLTFLRPSRTNDNGRQKKKRKRQGEILGRIHFPVFHN
ncbi:unnamed protein product [Ixodes persulcatus]